MRFALGGNCAGTTRIELRFEVASIFTDGFLLPIGYLRSAIVCKTVKEDDKDNARILILKLTAHVSTIGTLTL